MAVQISGNDITVPRDTTVTRNLTVGGVLTYEDVTNVDSIGIVTARAGVLVGSGITLSKDGDIFATGVTTSTTFSGNFSGGTVSGTTGTFTGAVSGVSATFLSSTNPQIVSQNTSGGVGVRLKCDNASAGTLSFSDAAADNQGMILYHHAFDRMQFSTAGSERARIDSSGRLLLGTTTEGNVAADDLTIATDANTGITLRSGSSSNGNIFFSDATSGNAELSGYIQYDHSSNYMRFGTAESERVRITSDGYLGINDTNPQATLHIEGHNVTNGTVYLEPHSSKGNNISHIHHGSAGNWYIRPADASGYIYHDIGKSQFTNGILFGTDTADANTLHDYEEGSATLTVYSNTNLALHQSFNVCDYTKVGNIVTMTMLLLVATVSGSDIVYITLPFTNRSESSPRRTDALGVTMHDKVNTGDCGLVGYLPTGSNILRFYKLNDNTSWSILTNSDLAVNDEIYVSITYKTAT